MLSLALLAAAVLVFVGIDASRVIEAAKWVRGRADAKKAAALLLVVVAFALMPDFQGSVPSPTPTPAPDTGPLSLEGSFTGPSASEDASVIGSMCLELADEIEWDGMQTQPMYKTGVSFDELRKVARQFRCRGISIGDRQPAARDLIAGHFEQHVGDDGGPVTSEQRAAWITAFRDVGRAASDASR